jgi:hypothetical protein
MNIGWQEDAEIVLQLLYFRHCLRVPHEFIIYKHEST